MRHIAYALIAALALAPIASAAYEEGQAECPPDEYCTTSVPEEEPGPADPDQPVSDGDPDQTEGGTDDTDDGDVRYSHNDAGPIPYGEEPYASGPAEDQSHAPVFENGEDELTAPRDDDATIPGFAGLAAIAALAALALVGGFWRRE